MGFLPWLLIPGFLATFLELLTAIFAGLGGLIGVIGGAV